MTILICVISGLICATLYRMGGSGRYKRATRVIGVPAVTTLTALILGVHNPVALLLSFGLTVAAISTYWDFLFNDWDNFWFHGFMLGVSAAPIAFITGHWWMFLFRCLGMAIFMGIWCYVVFKWDVAEETGRGFVIPATLFLII